MPRAVRVLIVEDDLKIQQEIIKTFRNPPVDLAWHFLIRCCQDGKCGIEQAKEWQPDVVLLDLGLPKVEGLKVLEHIKFILPDTRVCIISASNSLEKKLHSFRGGTDDYVVKPFAPEELLVRIVAIMRREHSMGSQNLQCGQVSLIPEKRSVKVKGKTVPLTKKEYELLAYLIAKSDQLVTRGELLDTVWAKKECYPNTVDAYIERLREKIDRVFGIHFLFTVYGGGYYVTSKQES